MELVDIAHDPYHGDIAIRARAPGRATFTATPEHQEPEEVNAYKAGDPGKLTVIVRAQDFRLPEVLRHIEAGKTVLVIPEAQRPALAAWQQAKRLTRHLPG